MKRYERFTFLYDQYELYAIANSVAELQRFQIDLVVLDNYGGARAKGKRYEQI